jgi:ribonuclease HI
MAKKFYVVWQGKVPGIYTDWNSCKSQVDKFAGAKYKSFPTLAEAEQAYIGTHGTTPQKTSTSKTSPVKKKAPSKATTVKTYTSAEIATMPIEVKIYTDGGCDPNPGKAGSGMAVYRNEEVAELWYGLYNPMGTNNTAELNALHQALQLAQIESNNDKSVVIFCDSKYSIQCVTQWAVNWQKKGWKKAGGEIKNLELIKEMFALHQLLKDRVQVLHVNGHVGVEGNELADRMSILAMSAKDTQFTRYQAVIDVVEILKMQAG